MLEQHRAGLERAVGDHHLGRTDDAVSLGDPLAQPRVPDPGAVGEGSLPVVGKRALRGSPHRLDGQDVGARSAAGEADQLGGHRASIGATVTVLDTDLAAPPRTWNPFGGSTLRWTLATSRRLERKP